MKSSFEKSGHESDPCFQPFINNPDIIKKMVTDTNVVAQETGIAALNAFLEFGGLQACLKTRNQVVGPLVEKTMGSARSGTKQKSTETLLLFIEMDTPEPIIEDMLPYLKHKTPKVVAGTTTALAQIFRQYGTKIIPYKPIIQAIPALFGHADKNVRAAAQALSIELYKWLGDTFKNVLFPDLKPVQQKDLDAEFLKVKDETPKQERFLRSQQEAMEKLNPTKPSAEHGNYDDQYDDDDEAEMDLFDPVEVLTKIPPTFSSQVTSSKWKERKEALEQLHAVLNQPKLKDDDYGDLLRILAKCMKDANIQVVALAANSIECIAKGLKSNFARYQSIVLSPILERLKEKKQTVSEALANALDAVYQCTSLSDVLEETLGFLKHKTPQVKIETANFLSRCLSSTKSMPTPAEIKSIIEHSIKLLSETQEPVRSAGAHILGTVMKLIGERAMNPFLESVDDIKKNKIKEWYEKAEVKAKSSRTARAPPPAPSVAQTPPAKAPAVLPPARGAAPSGRGSLPLRKRVSSGGSMTSITSTKSKSEHSGFSSAFGSSMAKLGVPGFRRPGGSNSSKSLNRSASSSSIGGPELTEDAIGAPQPLSAIRSEGGNSRRSSGRLPVAQERILETLPPPIDPGLSAHERLEFEKLKKECAEFHKQKKDIQELEKQNDKLHSQIQDLSSEKTHLVAEIGSLKEKNAKLVDEHTHDILSLKSRETQLTRSQTDLETARLRINQLEQEVDNVRQQLIQERAQKRMSYNLNTSSNASSNPQPSAHRQAQSVSAGRLGNNTNYSSNLRPSQRPSSMYGAPRRDWQQQQSQHTSSTQPISQRTHNSPKTPINSTGYPGRFDNDPEVGYGSPVTNEENVMNEVEELEEPGFSYDSQTPSLVNDKRASMYALGSLSNRQYLANGANGNGAANRGSRLSMYRSPGNYGTPSMRSQSSMTTRNDNGISLRTAYGGSSSVLDINNDDYGNYSNDHLDRSASRFGNYGSHRYSSNGGADQWQKTSQIAENLKQRIEFLKRRADSSKMQFDSEGRS